MGSIEAARQAGATEAASNSSRTTAIARLSTTGSKGLTSYNSELSKREVAADPNNPRMQPASASLPADDNTTTRIPERRDPNAIRIAISWLRSAKENATTV